MATLLDEILEATVKFKDDQGNDIAIKGSDLRIYCPKGATYEQINEFKMKVEALGLDPRRGDVYMALFKDKDGKEQVTILTNYQVYLRRAWASKKLDTYKIIINKPNENSPDTWTAKFIGRRTDSTQEFETPEIPVTEFNKKRNLWNIMPTVMVTVRMITFGLRWMLTDVLGGMPYIAEELESEESHIESQRQADKPVLPKADPEALKKMKVIEGVFKAIDKNKTIAELDAWLAKNVEKIGKSPNKDAYEEHIKFHEFNLTIAFIAEKTGLGLVDVQKWYTELEHNQNKALDALLVGDNDAIAQIRAEISDYMRSLETLQESAELAELGDGEQELEM